MSRKYFIFWGVLLALFAVRFFTSQENIPDGVTVKITYRVTSEPVIYEKSQYLRIHNLKVYLTKNPEIKYGDRIIVTGKTEGGSLKNAELLSIEESKNVLYKVREKVISFYRKKLPEPMASLLAGMVVGSKSSIPESFWDALKKTGTAHVVVASGMNVSLVAGFVTNLLIGIISRRKAVILTVISIWIYAFISGLEAPIVRAAIMGTVAFSAVILGRVYNALYALFLSAIVMLIIKPLWVNDLGFILSFVATLSLILFEKRVRKLFMWLPKFFQEGFSTSLAAQIGVAPILYFTFGQFNILSPVINALVLWTVGPITIIGMISAILSLFFQPLATIVLYISYPLALYFSKVVELTALI